MTKQQVDTIVRSVGERFRCFGGNQPLRGDNPLSHWLKDSPLQFALGVDVEAVVAHVLKESVRLQRQKKKSQQASGGVSS